MSDRPIANPTVVLREEFDDWAVLFDPETGDAYGLNPTAVLIWKLLDGEHDIDAMLQEVHSHAHEVPEDAHDHTASFVDALIARGLAGFQRAAWHAEKYACCLSEKTGTPTPVAWELPQLVNLNSDRAAFGANCTNGSHATNNCSTGNAACNCSGGSSGASDCCSGSCIYTDPCCAYGSCAARQSTNCWSTGSGACICAEGSGADYA